MAQRNMYRVNAFDANGAHIHGESTARVAQARKTARDFLRHVNVFTVDVTNESATTVSGYIMERYIKLTPATGVVVNANGESRNIRF